MTHTIFYELFWILIIFVWLRYSRWFKGESNVKQLLQYGFLLKVAVGFIFIYIYRQFYGSGALTSDASAFLTDSQLLNEVFFKAPKVYFSLLTGIGETNEMVQQYLADTALWSRGASTIFNDSQNVIRVNSLIYFLSRGNPHIHIIFMSLFSILGLRDLTIAFKSKIEANPGILFAGLILFPSVLFWSSGILKEPFLVLGLGILARGLMAEETRWKRIFRIIGGLLILSGIKPYVLICLFFALVYYLISAFVYKTRPWISLLIFLGFSSLALLAAPKFQDKLASSLWIKQRDSNNVAKGGLYAIKDTVLFYYFQTADLHKLKFADTTVELIEPVHATQKWIYKKGEFTPVYLKPSGEKWPVYLSMDSSTSFIETTPINHSFKQLVYNVPEAFTNALFRPFPTDPGSLMKYPALFEVFLCLTLLLIAIIYHRKLNIKEKRLLITLGLFTVSLLILIGWTTPVVGAIVRYRIPAYMAVFIISIFIIRIPEKWKKTIQ